MVFFQKIILDKFADGTPIRITGSKLPGANSFSSVSNEMELRFESYDSGDILGSEIAFRWRASFSIA